MSRLVHLRARLREGHLRRAGRHGFEHRGAQDRRAGIGVLLVEIRGFQSHAGFELQPLGMLGGPDVEFLREDARERLRLHRLHRLRLPIGSLQREFHLVALVAHIRIVVRHANDDALSGIHAAHLLHEFLRHRLPLLLLEVVSHEINRAIVVRRLDLLRERARLAERSDAHLILIHCGNAIARREPQRFPGGDVRLALRRNEHRTRRVAHLDLRDARRGAREFLDENPHVASLRAGEFHGCSHRVGLGLRHDAILLFLRRAGEIFRRRHRLPLGEIRGNLHAILGRHLVLDRRVVRPLQLAEFHRLLEIHHDEFRHAPVVETFPRRLAIVVNRAHRLVVHRAVARVNVRRDLHRFQHACEDTRVRPGLRQRRRDLAAARRAHEHLDRVGLLAHVAVSVLHLQVNVVARLEVVAPAEFLAKLQPRLFASLLPVPAQTLLKCHLFLLLDLRRGNPELRIRREPDDRTRRRDRRELLFEFVRVVVADRVRSVHLQNTVASLRIAEFRRNFRAEKPLARRARFKAHRLAVAAARRHHDRHVALPAAHAEVRILDHDVQRRARRVPLLRVAADEPDAAQQQQLVAETVLLPVEFGETIEDRIRHVARRREIHHVAEARLRVIRIAALLREHAEQKFAAARAELVLRLRHLLEDLRRIHIHLLVQVAFADAELRIHRLGRGRKTLHQRRAFRAREIVAHRLEIKVRELELRLRLFVRGHRRGVFVRDDPAAQNFLRRVARRLVIALEQPLGNPAQIIRGHLVLVLREQRLV